MSSSHTRDMTRGPIGRHLIAYAVPLVLANLFQLAYNAVDSMIVGRFIGKDGLAAVGTASPVMNFMVLGVSGLCIGASVIMSTGFGAGDEEKVKKELATVSVFGVLFSLCMTVLGLLITPWLLAVMQVPEEIRAFTGGYLRIIFLGIPFTFFYNALSGAMKSVGDSATPLKFVILSSVLNGVLDLIFIGYFKLGILCAAVTTVFAQGVSCALCVWYIYSRIPLLKLSPGEFRMDGPMLRETLRYGSVTALQQACQPLGKLFIQGAINSMGVDMMAAFNAVTRVDDFAFTPEQNIANSMTTFIAQNKGAGNTERIRKGTVRGLFIETGYWGILAIVLLLIRRPVMGCFTDDPRIIEIGVSYLNLMVIFYLFPAFTNGIQGFFRGLGMMKMTLLGTFIQISVRTVFVYLLTPFMGLDGVAWACVAGWTLMLLVQAPWCAWCYRKKV